MIPWGALEHNPTSQYIDSREHSVHNLAPVCHWLEAVLVGCNFPGTSALHTHMAAPGDQGESPQKAAGISRWEESM